MEPATTEAMPAARARRPWTAMVLITAVFVAHVIESIWIFPTPRALLDNDHPILLVDHALHLYHGALGSQFLREHGTTWGYDPFFMAGYPETPIWDSSSNLSILFQFLAGGGYQPRAYNVGLFICSLLVVAFIPLGAAAAGLSFTESAVATLMGWLYFHSSWADMLWRSGLFSFDTASAGLVLFIGVLLGFERRPTVMSWILLATVGSALWFVHVTAPVLVLGAVVGFGIATVRSGTWRLRLAIVGAGLCALVANLFWIAPFLRFRQIRSPQLFFMAPESGWHLVGQYLRKDLDGSLSLFLLATGLIGLIRWFARKEWARAMTFGGAILVCAGLAFFGGMWSVTTTLEPLRFKAPLNFLLAVPAGAALAAGSARLSQSFGAGRRGGLVVAAGWSIALIVAGVLLPDGRAILKEQLLVERPMVAGLRPEMKELVRALRENTDSSARILFEDQLRLMEFTDPESTHWTPLLPILLGRDPRQFLGGLYHMAFITHHQNTSFGDFHLGGRPIDRRTPEDLRGFSKLYNVGWVVCWSPLSRFWFDHWSEAKRVATVPRYHTEKPPAAPTMEIWKSLVMRGGPELAKQYLLEGDKQYNIYRIDRPRSFFLAGEGRVSEVKLNRIEMADVVPSQGAIILSLHWLDTFRTDPPLPIDPIRVPGDPVPFVRIQTSQPQRRIVIENRYGRN